MTEYVHEAVLVQDVVRSLVVDPDGIYVDGTVGTGGHSLAVGKHLGEQGCLVCLDKDPEAVTISEKRLRDLGKDVRALQGNYSDLDRILGDQGIETVSGVLLDLGMSTHQLEGSGRGFSFRKDEPLDMRMDPDTGQTAHHLVNTLTLEGLEQILKDYGEERRARAIAKAVVRRRKQEPIRTTRHLVNVVESVSPPSVRFRSRHPATRTFQALRISVNKELDNLKEFLNKIPLLITKKGRLVIISYHSLEDRLVKQAMVDWEGACTCPPDLPYCICGRTPVFRRVSKKPIRPGPEEIKNNPRARSAVLRAAERI